MSFIVITSGQNNLTTGRIAAVRPHTDGLMVCTRWRRHAPHLNTSFLGPTRVQLPNGVSSSAYHCAIRRIKKDEDNIIPERLANCIVENKQWNFWMEIKWIRSDKSCMSRVVDGNTDDWRTKYSQAVCCCPPAPLQSLTFWRYTNQIIIIIIIISICIYIHRCHTTMSNLKVSLIMWISSWHGGVLTVTALLMLNLLSSGLRCMKVMDITVCRLIV